jgi:hypothetical protein
MRSAWEGDGGSGLALGIECEAAKRLAAVGKSDGAGGAQTICAADGDEEVGFSVSVDVSRVDKESGLRGLLVDCGWGCKRRKCDGAEIGCNPVAELTYHVHCSRCRKKSSIARFSRVLPLYLAKPGGANRKNVRELDGSEAIREREKLERSEQSETCAETVSPRPGDGARADLFRRGLDSGFR